MNALLKIATITNLVAEIGDCDKIQLTLDDIIKHLTALKEIEPLKESEDKHKCDKCELFYENITAYHEGVYCEKCLLFEKCESLGGEVNYYLVCQDSNTQEKLDVLNSVKELISTKTGKNNWIF